MCLAGNTPPKTRYELSTFRRGIGILMPMDVQTPQTKSSSATTPIRVAPVRPRTPTLKTACAWTPKNSCASIPPRRKKQKPNLFKEESTWLRPYAHEKPDSYRRAGILEYILWRTEDDELDWFALENENYVQLPVDEKGVIRSRCDSATLARKAMRSSLAY